MKGLTNILFSMLGIKNTFQKSFFTKEFKDLTGASRKSIIALSIILALTISALGYAIGGIKYLGKRMDNPYTNWVNMAIPFNNQSKIPKLEQHFDSKINRDSFFLSSITKYKKEDKKFLNTKTQEIFALKCRSVARDESLLREILKKKNVVKGYVYKEGDDFDFPKCGIVIKQSSLVNFLSYDDDEELLKLPLVSSEGFIYFPEVVSIVKELPNKAHALYSNHYSNILNATPGEIGYISVSAQNIISFVGDLKSDDNKKNTSDLKELFKEYNVLDVDYGKIPITSKSNLDEFTLTLGEFLDFKTIRSLTSIIKESGIMTNPANNFKAECNIGDFKNLKNPHYLAYNFDKLDKVRALNEFLKNDTRFGMEITMDQVESKENFALVSNLTALMALILLGFSILSIVFYISSLLTTHLENIKNNLGTLKAFGLSNKFLVSVYLKIIILFILISSVIGLMISFLIKLLEKSVSKVSVIDLFDYRIFLTILVIVIISSVISYRTISKILLKTPGDLIYNR